MSDYFAVSLSLVDGAETSARETAPSGGSTDTTSVEISGRDTAKHAALPTALPQGSSEMTSGPQSPTLRAIQDMESGGTTSQSQGPSVKAGEPMRYDQAVNPPQKQSRSFRMLEQGLRLAEQGL